LNCDEVVERRTLSGRQLIHSAGPVREKQQIPNWMLECGTSKSHLVIEQRIRLERDAEHGETVFSVDHMMVILWNVFYYVYIYTDLALYSSVGM